MKKYPIVEYIDNSYLCGWKAGDQRDFAPDLANYINVIDICNQSPAE
jgi:hypothetical protein